MPGSVGGDEHTVATAREKLSECIGVKWDGLRVIRREEVGRLGVWARDEGIKGEVSSREECPRHEAQAVAEEVCARLAGAVENYPWWWEEDVKADNRGVEVDGNAADMRNCLASPVCRSRKSEHVHTLQSVRTLQSMETPPWRSGYGPLARRQTS